MKGDMFRSTSANAFTKERCPDTPISNKSLDRLQFASKNPYTKVASTFTMKIPVEYKILRTDLLCTTITVAKRKAFEMKSTLPYKSVIIKRKYP